MPNRHSHFLAHSAAVALGVLLKLLAAAPATGASGSLVVLSEDDQRSLLRISLDGQSVQTIASKVGGFGLAMAKDGSYLIANKRGVLKVTRSGSVKQLAEAPAGSAWTSIAVDSSENIIAADSVKPLVWRISPDGESVVQVAEYKDIDAPDRSVAVAVDPSGDYLLLAEGDPWKIDPVTHLTWKSSPQHFYRISPQGKVLEVDLHGPVLGHASNLTPIGDAGYLISQEFADTALYRLQADGSLTVLNDFQQEYCCITAAVSDPQNSDLYVLLGLRGLLVRRDAKSGESQVIARHLPRLGRALLYDRLQ